MSDRHGPSGRRGMSDRHGMSGMSGMSGPSGPRGAPGRSVDGGAVGLLGRVGGVLLAPRRLLANLPREAGRRDGAVLLLTFLLAVGLPELGAALADWWALGGLGGALRIVSGLLPLLPWVIATTVIEWRLGDARAHRAALCLVPLLVIAGLAHLLAQLGVRLPGPGYLPALLGGLASLALASAVRGSIAPDGPAPSSDLSPGTAAPDGSAPSDLSRGTAATASPELSPGTATTTSPDRSPGTAATASPDRSPGTATTTSPDRSPGTAAPAFLSSGTGKMRRAPGAASRPGAVRGARLLGFAVLALVVGNAGLDVTRLVRVWPTLAPVAAGDPLPAFAVPLLGGGTLRSADLRGAPHLLIFWTTWCGVCVGEMPMYRALAERHPGLRVVGVNADRDGDVPALVDAYREAHALNFPIALDDGGLVRGLRVRMFPHLVLVDAEGRVRAVFQGRALARSVDAAVAALL